MKKVQNVTEKRLRQALQKRITTLLAVGPMSKNCVDAVIELAYEHPLPLTLIASRRQVDAAELGGGYVNEWTTESFSKYVRKKDPKRKVILARDHGGPWQGTHEVKNKMNLSDAMASAKRSYEIDIMSGLDILHLDPSIDIHHERVSQKVIIERLFELYEYCMKITHDQGKSVIFEVGTEEQSGKQQTIKGVETFLREIEKFCLKNKYPKPFFVVVQTGTKVKEMRNIGMLGSSVQETKSSAAQKHISKLVELCNEFDVHIKEHNTDYLSDEILGWHPRSGIHAANVAPEFGVIETRQLLKICDEFGLRKEKEGFLRIAYESHKWEKWLVENSTATDYDKAVIAGHYVFSDPAFSEIKGRIAVRCLSSGFELDSVLRQAVKHGIRRYMWAFNMLV